MQPSHNTPQMVARVRIGVVPDGDQFYGFCPDLRGVHVGADTEEQAVKLAVEGAAVYLAMSIRHGDPIPVGVIEQQPRSSGMWKRAFTDLRLNWGQETTKSFVEDVPVALAATA